MSRLQELFKRTRREGRPALILYVTVGYPQKEATPEIVRALVEAGADAVELGIPFSDPVAEGTTIQGTSQRALENGVTPAFCLETAAACRRRVDAPLLFMTYYNPVLRYGLEAFCGRSAEIGVDGLIVPDLPADEGDELEAAARAAGLDTIYLLAPTSPEERVRRVVARSRGFVYLVSLTGVTGARAALAGGIDELIRRVRPLTELPLCVGFGISLPEHVRRLAERAPGGEVPGCDGVIVGSRLLQVLGEDGLPAAVEFVRGLRAAAERQPA
jgi:tryptophan synthase alpha chain